MSSKEEPKSPVTEESAATANPPEVQSPEQSDQKKEKRRRKVKKVIKRSVTKEGAVLSEKVDVVVKSPDTVSPRESPKPPAKEPVTTPSAKPRRARTTAGTPSKKSKVEVERTEDSDIDLTNREMVFAPYPKKYYASIVLQKPDAEGDLLVRFYGYGGANKGYIHESKVRPFDVETFHQLKKEKKLATGKGEKVAVEAFKRLGVDV
ncbi:hypothetical protein P9112_005787 [Eukaryota sp. TZLM1-RC]